MKDTEYIKFYISEASSDAVGQVLKSIIQFGSDGVDAGFNHPIDSYLQLLLCQAQTEPLLECTHGGRTMPEALQLGA